MPVIKRVRFEDNFTRYHNELFDILKGSGEAIGLHLYFMSKPENWIIRANDVEKAMGWGREKRRAVMNILIAHKLMTLDPIPGGGSTWTVYDMPYDRPENRASENPSVQKPVPIVTTETTVTTKRDIRAKRFEPPSVSEVLAYCQERGNDVDANKFVDYYTARGWKLGKNSMRDWKAAVRTWEKSTVQANNQPVRGDFF